MATNTTGAAELIDTGERDTLGRVVTPRERRQELVSAWQVSGLTQAAFAKQEGVRYSTFAIGCSKPRRGRWPGGRRE